MNATPTVLRMNGVKKSFRDPTGTLCVLQEVNLDLRTGEIALLQGPSGSGKTTLLQIAGCLLRADAGLVQLVGQEINSVSDVERTAIRQKHLGFAFQHFHLIDALTVRDNVALGLRFKRQPDDPKRVNDVLQLLGIAAKADRLPCNLSGGEKQRVAFARGLVGKPTLLLADEPTSQLDSHSAEIVAGLVRNLARQFACSVLIATHDTRLHPVADRVCTLRDGRIHE